jgi:hypothetical protein
MRSNTSRIFRGAGCSRRRLGCVLMFLKPFYFLLMDCWNSWSEIKKEVSLDVTINVRGCGGGSLSQVM